MYVLNNIGERVEPFWYFPTKGPIKLIPHALSPPMVFISWEEAHTTPGP